MKLPNKVYDTLKWVLIVVVPAFITLLNTLGTIYTINMTVATATISAFAVFFGAIIGISNVNYNKSNGK